MLEQKETLNNNNWTSFSSAEAKAEPIILLDEFEKSKDNHDKTIIHGILTSRIEKAHKVNSPYPARGFFKLKNREEDIPVIFRIKGINGAWIKPLIPKGSKCLLEGNFATSTESHRPSFTAYRYQILSHERSPWTFNKDHE